MRCGLTIAIFAAVLALTDLGGGKFGDDEIIATNEKASALSWYQSKSIKETQIEGQRDLLRALLDGNAVVGAARPAVEARVRALETEAGRYGREKKEILLGSSAVGESGWAQSVEGKLGQIIGAKQWEKRIEALSRAGDQFDYATLFLQISLVIGAVSLVLKKPTSRQLFFRTMIGLGLLGGAFSAYAFLIAITGTT